MVDEKIKIIKNGEKYYEHEYEINLDLPEKLYLPQHGYYEDEKEHYYYLKYWTYIVAGSWNRKSKNKLKYYTPVYKNCRNRAMRLNLFVFDTDTVKKAQQKITQELQKINEELLIYKKHILDYESELSTHITDKDTIEKEQQRICKDLKVINKEIEILEKYF